MIFPINSAILVSCLTFSVSNTLAIYWMLHEMECERDGEYGGLLQGQKGSLGIAGLPFGRRMEHFIPCCLYELYRVHAHHKS